MACASCHGARWRVTLHIDTGRYSAGNNNYIVLQTTTTTTTISTSVTVNCFSLALSYAAFGGRQLLLFYNAF